MREEVKWFAKICSSTSSAGAAYFFAWILEQTRADGITLGGLVSSSGH